KVNPRGDGCMEVQSSRLLRKVIIGATGSALALTSALAANYEDTMPLETVKPAPNLEEVLPHPEQREEAMAKLAEFESRTGKRPNILVYLMDDVGWGDLGVYGGGVAVGAPTPNMDALARDGLMLTSAYSQPSSSPTRATLLTGQLPVRHGILRPTLYNEPGGLTNAVTLAQLLSDAGYVTQAVGKWHMGENPGSQPQNVGFDDFSGFLSVSDLYTEWRDPYFYPEIANSEERTEMIREWAFEKYWVHAEKGGTIEQVKEIDIEVSSHLDEYWKDYSIEFIEKMADSDQPFFLYHCTRGAHFDNYPRDEYEGSSPAKQVYKDTIVELDDILGELVAALERTGQLENTLIFIASDNGPEMESWPDSAYSPFRGAKGSTWEGGVRVPAIFYWKGMIEPGRASDGLFDIADIFNTCLTLAGATDSIPTDRFIDGVDQTSFLLAEEGLSNRKYIYYWLMSYFSAVRVAEYKYVQFAESDSGEGIVNPGGFTGYIMAFPYYHLYNLYLDPKEEHNVSIRKLVFTDLFLEAMKKHIDTFLEYPPAVKIITGH
ncbi:arylsulfatase, partial [uncultured Mesotoga sp.]|uniref:arylsulfatase n=1 Tax=uncultured Mesotoga sp. TaxID=1184400 RepID=UPI0025979806